MTKTDQLQDLLAPTVHALGLELLGVEYLTQPGGSLVRLYIDVPEADAEGRLVGIDECEQVSREVSAQLDVEDPISGNYTLEVSSPGIERPLFSAAQFARFIGENAKVGLKLPQDGRRRLLGRIVEVVEGEVIRFDIDGKPFEVAHSNIEKARIAPDWVAMGFGAPKGTKKPGSRGGKAAAGKEHSTTSPTLTKTTGGAGSAAGGVEHE